MISNLIFEYSPWWILVCIVAGAGYAFGMYFRYKRPWNQETHIILSVLRLLLVSFISILLISPFINQEENSFEEPIVVLAIDDSESMALVTDSANLQNTRISLEELTSELGASGYEVAIRTLSNKNIESEELSFNAPESNISAVLKEIENDFQGRNLASVVLVSDGIYNRGSSPTFSTLSYKVQSVGAGDTIPKQDLIVRNLLYNKITYQGNKFPLIAEVINEGFVGESVSVSIIKGGQVIDSKNVRFTRNAQLQQVPFEIEATENGLQLYTVSLERREGEFTYNNNLARAYVDIIDGKEKILIAAPSPHPDIKAVIAALSGNDNYEVEIFIPGINELPQALEEFNLVIYHQIPDQRGIFNSYKEIIDQLEVPKFYILGSGSNIPELNKNIAPLVLRSLGNNRDLVTAALNPSFPYFSLSEDINSTISSYPPVSVPFGQIDLDVESSALLFQRVGSIETTNPLLIFSSRSDSKIGLFLGEGLWQWRLNEYAREDQTSGFDEVILKSVQFLVSKEDRRKFRVYPKQTEFYENEPILLITEAYNSLYEPIYNIKVDLRLVGENDMSQTFSYVTNESNPGFQLSNLETGVYRFTAKAAINEEMNEVQGQFIVKTMDLESINLTADHNLLRDLSAQTGGAFYNIENLEELMQDLIAQKPPNIIHSSEKFLPFINLLWVFILALVLISSEWFIRKYSGGY